jgi:salicylate hydroxylase
MTDPILIVGGGIGGLTAAVALQRQGQKVIVFEKARAIGDVGAGISIGVTASKGLYSLGLREALRAASDTPKASQALHYQTSEPLGGGFADRALRPEEAPYLNQIHRADLFAILQVALEAAEPGALRLGHGFVGYAQDEGGVTATFANGERARGQALIGCDGLRSDVRAQMFGAESPRFTGRVAYRFLVPMDKARPFMGVGGSNSYVGPGRSLLRYTIRHETLVNCVAFTYDDPWMGEGWSQRVSNDELVALFPGWNSDVIGLAANAPLEGTAKWALYDRDPLQTWVEGRVALLGDAAHPMLPFLGMGAAMAIEDAVILARAFAQAGDIEAGLVLYQNARAPRAGAILLESRRQGEMNSEGPGSTTTPALPRQDRINYDPSTVVL